MNIEQLPKDVLVLFALELNYPEILAFCNSHKNIDIKVCKNQVFWRNKLIKDYPDVNYIDSKLTPGGLYKKVYFIIKNYPELKDILSLLDIEHIDKFPILTYTSMNYKFRVKKLLENLNQKVLDKIKEDYNNDEYYNNKFYRKTKKIKNPNAIDILNFMRKGGLIYESEYKNYYEELIKELEKYINNPNYTFDPSVWEF